MNAGLFQREKPGIGHRKGRGALTGMVEPVSVLCRPILVEPVCSRRRRAVRQWRRQQLRERRHNLPELVGEFGYHHDPHDGQCNQHESNFAGRAQGTACRCTCRL